MIRKFSLVIYFLEITIYKIKYTFLGDFEINLAPFLDSPNKYELSYDLNDLRHPPPNYMPKDS